MKDQVDVLFVHGGPGLNSGPEERVFSRILEQHSIKAQFWHEPSNLRPKGAQFKEADAYKNWLDSISADIRALQPRVIVAISFGALGVTHLMLNEKQPLSAKLLFVSPTLDIDGTMKKMMGFSLTDFESSDPERFEKIKALTNETKSFWDQPMQAGVSLAWENPNLPLHYFEDIETLKKWGAVMSEPSFQVDNLSQNKVFEDFIAKQKSYEKVAVEKLSPPTVILGDKDRLCPEEEVRTELSRFFKGSTIKKFSKAKHFPHLEKPEEFIQVLRTLL